MSNNFNSISSAARSLKDNLYCLPGHKRPIARSKVFADHKRGLFVVADPSAITPAEVDSYIVAAGLVRMERKNPTAMEDLFAAKTRAQARAMEARAAKAEYELNILKGRYLLKDEVRLQIAIKIGVFEAGFKNAVRVSADDWIHKVGGDVRKFNMFCELVYAVIDQLLGEFADLPEINVLIQKQEEKPSSQECER